MTRNIRKDANLQRGAPGSPARRRFGLVLPAAAGALLVAAAAAPAAYAQSAAGAQDWPNRPVRILVAYQAGQGTDVATRYFAEHLTRAFGQSFIVENRPGAGGNIGTAAAAKAPADGYTLIMGTVATHTMNQHMYDNLGYDPDADFDPIILTGMLPMVISVNPSHPAKTLRELIDAARAKPDSINVAIPSTTARIVHELLKQRGVVALHPVPYKGSAGAMTDVIGGQVPATIDTVTATRAQSTTGKLRPLAITTARTSELLPGVPSVAEQGVPGFEVTAWNALYAPKGTPQPIIDRIAQAMQRILAQPETRQRLLQIGFEPAPADSTPKQLAEFTVSERKKWGEVIKTAGIRAD
ncbi:MAG TPA: tripartite tricarboxylate transporter substrate binding protein [Burkholderiaceae bacterium]|nr:tripartite tricarboxylate transporter substrate binding protein [Burkholderiaceae bacterium]